MPTSRQDANAGNAGDLVKHSVIVQTLSTLLPRDPWSSGLQLFECHAGRGVYQPQDGDERNRENVRRLLRAENLALARQQCSVLEKLGHDHADINDGKSYAGSACLSAAILSDPKHSIRFYEKDKEVSTGLQSWACRLKTDAKVLACDGEAAIARICGTFNSNCLVLLDPFSIPKTTTAYPLILRAAAKKGPAPLLIFFYSWGKRFASNALRYRHGQTSDHPIDSLRGIIGARAIELLWYHKRQYLMWVVVPSEVRAELHREFAHRMEEIRSTLFQDAGADDDHSWVVVPLKSE
jgi:23S rRNA A2030 N6-methylase RlmJ